MFNTILFSLLFISSFVSAEPASDDHSIGFTLPGVSKVRDIIETMPSDISDETKWRGIACFGAGHCTYENLKTGVIHKFAKAKKENEPKENALPKTDTKASTTVLKKSEGAPMADVTSEKHYRAALEDAKQLGLKTVVLKIGADRRCPPCRRLSGTLKEMAKTQKETAILFADTDEASDLVEFYSKPAMGAMRFGGTIPQSYIISQDESGNWKVRETFIGAKSTDQIQSLINSTSK